jgi:hypothetical protein
MCRGYITRGLIDHTERNAFGPGHTDSVEGEKQVSIFKRDLEERATPFIQVDKSVVAYVAEQSDRCVKEMFQRMTISDGGLTALFPIKRLSHEFAFGFGLPKLDIDKEKAKNDVMRKNILKIRQRVTSLVDANNKSAASKCEHYVRALDEQLKLCDTLDNDLDMLGGRYPARR